MNHLSKCLNRLEALDRHVTNLLGKPCEEEEEKKIHAIRWCGCLRYIKQACALFHVHGIQWTYIQNNMTEYVPLDVEQKLRDVMQCLSSTDNSYGKYIKDEIGLIRVDLAEFRKACTPVIAAATPVIVDDPMDLDALLLQLKMMC